MAFDVTIFHNPGCGTSRSTLAILREAGVEPRIVEYLKTPPTKDELRELARASGSGLRPLLREKEALFTELGLGDPEWSDDELLDFVVAHPVLLNRPLVVTPLGTRLCRPAELVRDLLPKG